MSAAAPAEAAYIGRRICRGVRSPVRHCAGHRRKLARCVSVLALGGTVACGNGRVADPFALDPADGGIAAGDAGPAPEALIEDEDVGRTAAPLDPTLGGPCLDDGQCDDGAECTEDACDLELGRCRFVPDDSVCQNDGFCDGDERCVPAVGCRPGVPLSCDDDSACTIDRCNETDRSCEHTLRDADGDGDPDIHCVAGPGDCDDNNPAISSNALEVCDNALDDDCDGEQDEADCRAAQYDTCDDPLVVDASGTFQLSSATARTDFGTSCAPEGALDMVVEVVVSDERSDVDLVLSGQGSLAFALVDGCGEAGAEVRCVEEFPQSGSARVARLRLRDRASGRYTVLAFADRAQELELQVTYSPASMAPANESCAAAASLEPGVNTVVDLLDARVDVASACDPSAGDLLYRFELNQPQDVRLFAASVDGLGEPVLSLRRASCTPDESEIACVSRAEAELFVRDLPPGEYFVGVSASAPTLVDLVLVLDAVSEAPASDSCSAPPPIELGQSIDVDMSVYSDAVPGCQPGARDAIFGLELDERSDVLLVQHSSGGDVGSISLAPESCAAPLACPVAGGPARTVGRGLEPGSYRVVAQSELGEPIAFSAFARAATPPVFISLSDTCETAESIPEGGGFFQGNTGNAFADWSVGCDRPGEIGGAAADQILRFELTEPQTVVFDMAGSSYETVLSVRQGAECPGDPIAPLCVAGRTSSRSFLTAELQPGVYWIQIDGYARAEGQWSLDVHTAEL